MGLALNNSKVKHDFIAKEHGSVGESVDGKTLKNNSILTRQARVPRHYLEDGKGWKIWSDIKGDEMMRVGNSD